ncbi:MAG: hypothetical protein KDA28_10265 [Phycisphaerales bacterium]|nr:hypothetical protein [Phycisphaerales bacterium]
MDDVRPSQWLILISGVLLFAFSFMEVFKDSDNAWKDIGTLTMPAIFGIIATIATAATAFGYATLPDDVLTFSFAQILVVLAFTSVLIEIGAVGMGLFSDVFDAAAGAWLSALAAIGLLMGTVMEQEGGPTRAAASTPPSPF